jgi:hypothetical protein
MKRSRAKSEETMEPKGKDQLAAARSSFGPLKDLRSVHSNGAASLGELREFLGTLHGKSPQEVIGIVSTSLLVQSMLIAVAGTLAILFVFTLGPYLVYGPPQARQAAKKPAPAPAQPAAAAAAAAPATGTDPTSQPDAEAAAKVLGIDEAKPADPTKNPLDNPNLDKLLDGVD